MSNVVEKWMSKKAISPFRELSQMEDSLERLMSDFIRFKTPHSPELNSFSPSCEVSEEGNKLVMKFDLPGVTKENLRVEANQDQLTISAERKEEKKSETKKKFLSEVFYGSYSRTFTLPAPVDEKNIEAKFENGVLTVTLPKNEISKSKQIPVQ